MITDNDIWKPFLFNPLKHHLGFIREFINLNIDINSSDLQDLAKDLKHLGSSVMDIYTGSYFPCPQQSAYLQGKIQYTEISADLHYNNR
jgi:hypothetical protein